MADGTREGCGGCKGEPLTAAKGDLGLTQLNPSGPLRQIDLSVPNDKRERGSRDALWFTGAQNLGEVGEERGAAGRNQLGNRWRRGGQWAGVWAVTDLAVGRLSRILSWTMVLSLQGLAWLWRSWTAPPLLVGMQDGSRFGKVRSCFFVCFIFIYLDALGLSCGHRIFKAAQTLYLWRGLSSHSAQAYLLQGTWDLPQTRIELQVPSIVSEFSTTGPGNPGSSLRNIYIFLFDPEIPHLEECVCM